MEEYIERKKQIGVFGNRIEIVAVSQMTGHIIEIYEFTTGKLFLPINNSTLKR